MAGSSVYTYVNILLFMIAPGCNCSPVEEGNLGLSIFLQADVGGGGLSVVMATN
jgi:hypothetical protein